VLLGKEDLLVTADGTDSDQVEADVQSAVRKLIAIDDERSAGQAVAPGASPAAPAPGAAAPAATNYGGMVPGDSAAQAAPAPAEGSRRAVVPGAAPRAPEPDEAGVVSKEHRAAAPAAVPVANDEAARKPGAQADAPPAERPAEEEKPAPKKKGKGIKGKSGTEKWDDE
jgi:hypothetical protein